MNCTNCGGRLEGNLTVCPFCGCRQDIDLAQIHYRNIEPEQQLPCPGCGASLGVIEFDTDPAVRIERCPECQGLFFNPGELEALLHAKVAEIVWVDPQRLDEISRNFGHTHEVVYRRCPICRERMSHLNFGGRSGVILDRCGSHGVWLEAGELRRLLEWWRAGGKHIHQRNEQAKLGRGPVRFSGLPPREKSSGTGPGTAGGGSWGRPADGTTIDGSLVGELLAAVTSFAALWLD